VGSRDLPLNSMSGMASATESCVCSVCGAFDAAFAKLLWHLSSLITSSIFCPYQVLLIIQLSRMVNKRWH